MEHRKSSGEPAGRGQARLPRRSTCRRAARAFCLRVGWARRGVGHGPASAVPAVGRRTGCGGHLDRSFLSSIQQTILGPARTALGALFLRRLPSLPERRRMPHPPPGERWEPPSGLAVGRMGRYVFGYVLLFITNRKVAHRRVGGAAHHPSAATGAHEGANTNRPGAKDANTAPRGEAPDGRRGQTRPGPPTGPDPRRPLRAPFAPPISPGPLNSPDARLLRVRSSADGAQLPQVKSPLLPCAGSGSLLSNAWSPEVTCFPCGLAAPGSPPSASSQPRRRRQPC
jgi:hypothetical protein